MKKLLLLLCALLSLTADAQISADLDEVEITGSWSVTARTGKFNASQYPVYNNERKLPVAFNFKDNAETLIEWQFAAQTQWQSYTGYWITHTSDRYILHLLAQKDYSTGGAGTSLLNFIIYYYDGNTMKLESIDSYGTLTLTKETTAVASVTANAANGGRIYGLDGKPLKSPQSGIYIQDGEKYIKQ